MKKIRTLAVLMLSLSLPIMARAEEVKLTAKDLTNFIATAITNNSDLKSSQSRWEVLSLLGLVPIMWSTGTGADVMKPKPRP